MTGSPLEPRSVWWCDLHEVGRARGAVTLVERLGRLRDARMRQVCDALDVAVPCER